MNVLKITLLIITNLLLIATPLNSSAATSSKTITVDCTKGDSIMKALAGNDNVKELVIEIKGVCEEHVAVNRSGVTLRGSSIPPYDPAATPETPVDGIHGLDVEDNTLRFTGVGQGITSRVENLLLSGGNFALAVNYSLVRLQNVQMTNDEWGGAVAGSASSIDAWDVSFSGGYFGAWIVGARFNCTNCTFSSPRTWGQALSIVDGASANLTNCSSFGHWSILAVNSKVIVQGADSVLESVPTGPGFGTAVEAQDGASVVVEEASVTGPVSATRNSNVRLRGVIHSTPASTYLFKSVFDENSSLVLEDTSIDRSLQFWAFSNGTFRGTSTVTEDLACSEGADAWCDDPQVSVGGTSNCGKCAK
jgi:hypothetical protein